MEADASLLQCMHLINNNNIDALAVADVCLGRWGKFVANECRNGKLLHY